MSTLYALTLVQATANLRIDLNDPTGGGSRWQDTDLQRALDRANERITAVEPDLESVQIATVAQQNIYAKPAGALWIDRVEYPAAQWPPSYPAFTELRYPTVLSSPLFTAGTDVFRLELPPEQYPPDAVSYYIEVRYALKHELDASGTTMPERYWDALYNGGKVAAIDIYLANINDNFVYADGQLRDRVDDTKSVDAWRSYRDLLEQSFVALLKQIRDEQIQSSRFTPAWGDKPLRWEKV